MTLTGAAAAVNCPEGKRTVTILKPALSSASHMKSLALLDFEAYIMLDKNRKILCICVF